MSGGLMQLIAYGAQDISEYIFEQSIEWKNEIISFKIPKKTKCPITFDLINISNGVCKCLQCRNLFDYPAYKEWIDNNTTCPVCRTSNIEYTYYTRTIKSSVKKGLQKKKKSFR
jgi:hypothetical protein